MKPLRFLSLLLLTLALTPALIAADFGLRGGRYSDIGEEFVGAEVVFDAGSIHINPNLEYSLAEDITAGSANLDLTLDLGNFSRATPYVGAGIGLWYADSDAGDTTDILGNLIGGVQFDLDYLKPYAQVKYFRLIDNEDGGGTGDDLAFTIGLRF